MIENILEQEDLEEKNRKIKTQEDEEEHLLDLYFDNIASEKSD